MTSTINNQDEIGMEVDESANNKRKIDGLWDVACISISPMEEEKVECCNNRCSGIAVATWTSNLHPEQKRNLCNKCNQEEMGGCNDQDFKDEDFKVLDKEEADTPAAVTTAPAPTSNNEQPRKEIPDEQQTPLKAEARVYASYTLGSSGSGPTQED